MKQYRLDNHLSFNPLQSASTIHFWF